MNIQNALHTLLQSHAQQLQAPRNAGRLQQAHVGGQIQLQNTVNNQPMAAAIQQNGANIQQPGYTPAQMHQMTPVGQPIPKAMMDSFSPQTRALAQLYQQNPTDPRVMHLDPAMFGYAPDNSGQPGRGVSHPLHQLLQMHGGMQPHSETPFAQPNMQQAINMQGQTIQGVQNPGATPGQGGRGVPNIQSTNRRGPQIRF